MGIWDWDLSFILTYILFYNMYFGILKLKWGGIFINGLKSYWIQKPRLKIGLLMVLKIFKSIKDFKKLWVYFVENFLNCSTKKIDFHVSNQIKNRLHSRINLIHRIIFSEHTWALKQIPIRFIRHLDRYLTNYDILLDNSMKYY